MIGLVMAGGRGTRMGGGEKLVMSDEPLVLRAVAALEDSGCIVQVAAVTSPNSPGAQRLLDGRGVRTIRTPGGGYAEDLYAALAGLEGAVMVVSGDMPLLDGDAVRHVASLYDGSPWTAIVCGTEFARSLGMEPGPGTGGASYTGVSLVNASEITSPGRVPERRVVINDRRLVFNVNTRRDYELFGAV